MAHVAHRYGTEPLSRAARTGTAAGLEADVDGISSISIIVRVPYTVRWYPYVCVEIVTVPTECHCLSCTCVRELWSIDSNGWCLVEAWA
jgi:hypothetical protein